MTPQPEVIITPSPDQYRQLAADLRELRENGAESNTAAVVKAVSEEAAKVRRERMGRAA